MKNDPFRIGTRGSPLALAQARQLRAKLAQACGRSEDDFPITVIRTSGDQIQDRPLSEAGGKGLFTKELDSALIDDQVDLAVHSSKDLPTHLPSQIKIAGFLAREDVRDAWIGRDGITLEGLAQGSIIGTASLRRAAQIKRKRPDLQTKLLRGNVETRLRRVQEGEIDATLLALAGLKRLGLEGVATSILSLEDFLPAVGQGAIGITCRADDALTLEVLQPLLDTGAGFALAAERAFLAALDGSCRTPIAGYACLNGKELTFHGEVLKADGSETYSVRRQGPKIDAALMGDDAGNEIMLRLPYGIKGLM